MCLFKVYGLEVMGRGGVNGGASLSEVLQASHYAKTALFIGVNRGCPSLEHRVLVDPPRPEDRGYQGSPAPPRPDLEKGDP